MLFLAFVVYQFFLLCRIYTGYWKIVSKVMPRDPLSKIWVF